MENITLEEELKDAIIEEITILNASWNADIICKLALEKQEILPLACMD